MQCAEPITLFRDSVRHIDGLTAYPMDWVSGQLRFATAIFAEVTPSLQRQVCRIGNLPEGLIGFQGASAFDFYNSRFRGLPGKRRITRRDGCAKVAIPHERGGQVEENARNVSWHDFLVSQRHARSGPS